MEEVEARKEAGGFQEMGAYEESLLETKVKKFGLDFERIGDEDIVRLEEAFSEKKVFSALSELNGNKAPGPNGFTIAF
ncbi:hypothetical protein CK203_114422 [Vitis vinifera]|uniref:Uncharacterized protein n=1 Tax=Vitis vinifera TaxID=29760 RepID=A0A438C9C6_VITVI|nr:hypothetical protein CK203_114422 [Vitis vinifera]